jgi:hypothetical protein
MLLDQISTTLIHDKRSSGTALVDRDVAALLKAQQHLPACSAARRRRLSGSEPQAQKPCASMSVPYMLCRASVAHNVWVKLVVATGGSTDRSTSNALHGLAICRLLIQINSSSN